MTLSTALHTDRYELTMLDAALRDGTAHRRCVFELFARRLPGGRRFGVVAGTYNIGVYGEVAFDVTVPGTTPQITTYTEGSSGNTVKAFRLGTAGALETNARISSEQNCYSCHRDLQFHGSLVGRARAHLARVPGAGRRTKVLVALGIWQLANAAGFAMEAVASRTRRFRKRGD